MPLQFLENIVFWCFERRFSKQNSVIRLKSNISPPIFGLATSLVHDNTHKNFCRWKIIYPGNKYLWELFTAARPTGDNEEDPKGCRKMQK